MCNVFNGYELLLFKWFQSRPLEWKHWRGKLKEREEKGVDSFGDIPQELWFLSVTLHQRPRYLLQLVRLDIERDKKQEIGRTESLLTKYMGMNHFTEFHLDSIFHYGEDNSLPKEIFRCVNLRYLSLKYNFLYEIPPDIGRLQKLEYLALTNNRLHVQSIPYTMIFRCANLRYLSLKYNFLYEIPPDIGRLQKLEYLALTNYWLLIFRCANLRYLSLKYNFLYEIPPDIGRLQKLEYLALTNNRLHVQSIPYTMVFCVNLKTLLLDNNLLDALPGFLLEMTNLETVHRHGNHNYFKSTFMWYHTDVHHRIIPVYGISDYSPGKPASLSFWAAKALVASKKNFFADPDVPPMLKDYICNIYEHFNICQNCPTSSLISKPGFKVITFKNPYLGNTCVPFQHWVCSLDCARSLEVPARLEQIAKAQELDCKYEEYVSDCMKKFGHCPRNQTLFSSCLSANSEVEVISEISSVIDCNELSSDTCSYVSTEMSQSVKSNSSDKKCILM